MKQVIVMIAMLMLGLAIYSLVAGDDDSIKSSVGGLWRSEIEQQQTYP
ncbi:hypothetical protein [Sinanaerobacter chloroacetimidivorans]|uniref:Uncharacterized protein n=1 Tax=Sinanaerobacter chloroacetimidivorans TaxID=2818044 RepID=A0A8J8B1F3_9FIRM|nr:hypothetical protein [Sinanaerobacter chloroacetimidivorans]MBR0597667.1 hypothetical protein [Sinanaerobacter chloroacetimidivorans]